MQLQSVNPDVFTIITSYLNPDDLFSLRITCKSLWEYIDNKIIKRLSCIISRLHIGVINELKEAEHKVNLLHNSVVGVNENAEKNVDKNDEDSENESENDEFFEFEYNKTHTLHKICIYGINIDAKLYQITKLLDTLNSLELKIVKPQKCRPNYCELCSCSCVYIPYFSNSKLSFCYYCIIKHQFISNNIKLFYTSKLEELASLALNYNFLRIMSGHAGLSYSN